jgi:hypothetical protein
MVTVTGGDRFREKLQGIARQITNASAVKVGFLAESTYPDGTPVAMVALRFKTYGRRITECSEGRQLVFRRGRFFAT